MKKIIRVNPEVMKRIKANGMRWLNECISGTENLPDVPAKRERAPGAMKVTFTEENYARLLTARNISAVVEAVITVSDDPETPEPVIVGRPGKSQFDEHASYIYRMLAVGVTKTRIAKNLSMPAASLRRWIRENNLKKEGTNG